MRTTSRVLHKRHLEVKSMKRRNETRHGGFTLVEMLVVIAIIGILAAILVPTLYIVVNRAKQNKIAQEISQLAMQIEAYKEKYGDYPPDCTDAATFTRHLRRAFPRHAESIDPTTKLPVNSNFMFPDGTVGTTLDPTQLDPSEALVFWLGMIKNDPRQPLNGTSPPTPLFPFDENRLLDVDNDGWLSYIPPDGKDAPYVYFDARTYSTASLVDSSNNTILLPYMTARDATTPATDWKFANPKTYQIVSAGLDGEYGEITTNPTLVYKAFPFGNNYAIADLDNIANFSDGKIFEDRME
jgi:prepilin-type N-terminal cleavage/methylation domain-containing protein